MREVLQDLYFAVGALGVDVVAEGPEYLLECVGFGGEFVENAPDVTVCPRADELADAVAGEDVGFYLFLHLNY